MSKGKIFLLVLLVLVVALAVAVIVADQKYEFIASSPRVSHETLVKPETRAIIYVDPQMAKDIVAKSIRKVPAWIFPLALPNEGAFVVDMDMVRSDMRLKAFINDKRFGPVICQKINSATIPAPFDQWLKDAMQNKERGVLLREGSARIDRNLINRIREQWQNPEGAQPPHIQGGHMAEVALENRDGSAVAIIAGIMSAAQKKELYIDRSQLGMLAPLQTLHATADLTPENALQVQILIECSDKDPAMIAVIQMMLEMGLAQVQPVLAAQNTPIEGKSEVKGSNIEANYLIKNFDALIQRLT